MSWFASIGNELDIEKYMVRKYSLIYVSLPKYLFGDWLTSMEMQVITFWTKTMETNIPS